MNRAKIEEKLKVAEKEYSSVMFLSDSKSFMKMKIAQAKIQLLTSLLAEDGGEVKDICDTCNVVHHWADECPEGNQQQAPSAEENPQPTDEERKYFAEHNNSRIIKYAEAPSATDKLSDIQKEAVTEFTKWKEGLSVYKAPSATVNLPAIKTLFAKWCNAKTEDTHSNAMTLNAFAVAVAELLHSQQPALDVEEIARECVDSLEEAKLLEVSALTERINLSDREDAVRIVSKALTEALRGSYTREDMMKAYSRGQGDVADASLMDDYTRPLVDATEFIQQYDTERGK